MKAFHTLAAPIEIGGVGLHCGREVTLRLCPDERVGWRFVRRDLPGAPQIAATLENVVATRHATVLSHGEARVSTTEHLLAALWALDVTHARLELDGPEVPILDGSAQPWVEAIARAGKQLIAGERPVWALREPLWWSGDGASVLGLPTAPGERFPFRLSVAVDFDHPHAGAQVFDGAVDGVSFARELAPARTFTLENWIEPLRCAGLIRGGSLENAVLIGAQGPSSPPRLSGELARHKALDCVGDLALLFGAGGAFAGHIVATRAGHGPHRGWMESCRAHDVLQRI